jgi:ERF superfamily
MKNSESIIKIASALLKAQKVMGNATKDSKNPFFKSKYADLNAIREAVIPPLNENGISVLQPTIPLDGKLYVQTVLLHESGEFISSLTEVVCTKQNDPQQLGSALSYSRRYGLQSIVCVGAEDDDAESAMSRTSKIVSDQKVEAKAEVKQETTQAPAKKFGGFGSKAK